MSKPLGIAAWLFALAGFAFAQNNPLDADWQNVRDHQPAALHLKMTLAKDHFFQGEEINATLEFSNDDPQPVYGLVTAWWAPGAKFHAADEKGNPVIDPLGWCQEWISGRVIDGVEGVSKLGQYILYLPVNEDVRFDQPGVYTIHAQSRVSVGADLSSPDMVSLVSNKVTVTITPITPDQGKQVIADSLSHIGPVDPRHGPDAPTADAIDRLKYLQTPAARAELIKLMNNPAIMEQAAWGMEAAPDPAEAAENLLAAVKSGQLVLGPYGVTIYAELKSFPLLRKGSTIASEPEKKERAIAQEALMKQARQELLDAMVQAPGQTRQAHAEALWTVFDEMRSRGESFGARDVDGGAARKAVANCQLDLSDATVQRLLGNWYFFGSADFLPLVQREVKKRGDSPNALIALCKLKPDEARPLVLAEMTRPDSNFFKGSYVPSMLLSVPPMPLPELDDLFRSKLADPNQNPGQIIPIIACFGSTNLLPAVLGLYQHHGPQYTWGPDDQTNLYFYWLRCDPKAAIADFEHEIQSGNKDCWISLYMTLALGWSDIALPLVRVAVKSDTLDVSSEAVEFLLKHGDDADMDSMIRVLESSPSDKNYARAFINEARTILADNRWHLTAGQKKRLEVLASTPEPK